VKGKTQKAEITRQRILDAAVDFFYEYGYEKASLQNIADQVGLTKAALYHHFKSKEEILYTIIEKYTNQLVFALKSSVSKSGDPAESLKNAIFQHVSLLRTQKKGAKIIIEDKRFLTKDLQGPGREKERIIFRFYQDILLQLKKKSKLKDIDITVATFGILGQINWLYHWYRPDKPLSFEQVADILIRLLFHGLLEQNG
jgi:AcrR family transcriptional regulator